MRCNHCMKELKTEARFCPYCGQDTTTPAPPHHLPAGTVLHGKFLIGSAIGEGGFGITYVGFDQTLKLKVAIKEYFPTGYANRNNAVSNEVTLNYSNKADFYEHGKKSFLREAQSIAAFSKERGVVDVRDFFEENNTAYIVMEYLDGVTLGKYVRDNGVFPAEKLFRLMLPLMQTLEKMHAQNVIHRDIAPDNIMLLDDKSLKLTDFGAARYFSGEDNKSLSVVLKPGYAPYEQYSRKGRQGPWTDVYALCATIYQCTTGVTPPDSLDRSMGDELQKPSALGVSISLELEAVLLKGLEIKPQDRTQNMSILIDAVMGALTQKPAPTDPPKETPEPAKSAKPKPPILKLRIPVQTDKDQTQPAEETSSSSDSSDQNLKDKENFDIPQTVAEESTSALLNSSKRPQKNHDDYVDINSHQIQSPPENDQEELIDISEWDIEKTYKEEKRQYIIGIIVISVMMLSAIILLAVNIHGCAVEKAKTNQIASSVNNRTSITSPQQTTHYTSFTSTPPTTIPIEMKNDSSYFFGTYVPTGKAEDLATGKSVSLRNLFEDRFSKGSITFSFDGTFVDTLSFAQTETGEYLVENKQIKATYYPDKNMDITVTKWNEKANAPTSFFIIYQKNASRIKVYFAEV